ncbi:MAG TPA: transcriptional regulator, partial [Kocuria sp.]|nr:transcriptional regulator [Kocuria sp.]
MEYSPPDPATSRSPGETAAPGAAASSSASTPAGGADRASAPGSQA